VIIRNTATPIDVDLAAPQEHLLQLIASALYA
jgi:hypothetical protein